MKTVLIIWSSSGLGESLVSQFIQAWYQVVGLGRNKNSQTAAHIDLDLANHNSILAAANMIKSNYPVFEVLVICSGIGYIEWMKEQSREHNQEVFNVNVIGPTYLLWELLPTLLSNGADLVFIGATIAFKANEYMPVYSMSKWWQRGLIENIRLALKAGKCRVIWVHPGGMNTESNVGHEGRETIISAKTSKVVWNLMDPVDIAKHIVELTSLPKNIEVGEVIINRK